MRSFRRVCRWKRGRNLNAASSSIRNLRGWRERTPRGGGGVLVLPRRDFDHVVRRGFFLAGRADADVAGLGAQRGERRRPEVTHAALHATDEVVDRVVE